MDHKRAALFKELEKGYGSEVGDEADGHTAFLALAARCKSDDGLSWSHFLSTIGRKFLPRVCQAVAHHAAAALGDGESTVEAINSLSQGVEVSESGTDARLRLQVLTAVTEFAAAFLSSSKLPAPDALLQTVGALHSILLMLHGTEAEGLQAAIAAVCEQWWLQEKPGREAVITQLLPYLLVKSLEESARPRDVRRVWGMREALLILDFEDDSIESLTELLLRCFLHPLYLRSRGEGRRFLAFLFGLHPVVIDAIHQTVKNQLPCTKGLVEAYGEVFFRAWRAASGQFLVSIEHNCVQDWMNLAIHSAVPATFTCLRQLIACFVAEKRQAGVDEMLMRLYEPLLWRALDASNAAVRRNAATLFIDAFPLQDADTASRADIDALLQRQFDALSKLLHDDAPTVRVVGVQGVCRVLSVFWELIPAATAKNLLKVLVTKMAYDSRSTAVRASVFQGIEYLLDCALSHSAMKLLLPSLGRSIHDRSERVRRAVVNMLLRVSRIRGIRFADIVGVDHLLARLVLDGDNTKLASGITQLLMASFMPQGKPGSQQLTRALDFLSTSPAAALVFYRHAHAFCTVGNVAKLIILLQKALHHALSSSGTREPLSEVGAKRARGGSKKTKGKGKGKGKSRSSKSGRGQENVAANEPEEEEHDILTTSNTRLMCNIVRAITTLWESIHAQVEDEAQFALKERLHAAFSVAFLERLFDVFSSSVAERGASALENAEQDMGAALTALLGVMPPTHAKSLCQNLWDTLQALTPATASQLPAVLTCLCRWDMSDRLWKLLLRSLNVGFMVESLDGDTDDDSGLVHPVVAVLGVEFLAAHNPCGAWSTLVADSRPGSGGRMGSSSRDGVTVSSLNEALVAATTCLEIGLSELFDDKVLDANTVSAEEPCDVAAPLAVRAVCQLAMLVEGHDGLQARSGEDVPELRAPFTLTRLLSWCTTVALPLLRRTMSLTSDDLTAKCGALPSSTTSRANKAKRGGARSSKKKASASCDAVATAAALHTAVRRRVRATYDACAVILGATADCVALGVTDAEFVVAARAVFGATAGVSTALAAPSSPGAEAPAAPATKAAGALGDGSLLPVLVAVPPAPVSALVRAGAASAPADARKRRGAKRTARAAKLDAVDAPCGGGAGAGTAVDIALSPSSMSTPLLLHGARLLVQLGKRGSLSASRVQNATVTALATPSRHLLPVTASHTPEERRGLADAGALRLKPLVSAALWLHARAGSVTAAMRTFVAAAKTYCGELYAEPGGAWSPPELNELPCLAANIPMFIASSGPKNREAFRTALLSSLQADADKGATFALLAASLASTRTEALPEWKSVCTALKQVADEVPADGEVDDLADRLAGMSTWIATATGQQ